jgi:hypothetical protein
MRTNRDIKRMIASREGGNGSTMQQSTSNLDKVPDISSMN